VDYRIHPSPPPNNRNLTILQADKGNATVVLNTSDYKQKFTSLLEDPAYRKLAKDPTDAIERKTTLLLKKSSLTKDTPATESSRFQITMDVRTAQDT
jgi:hypothetical protein